MQLNHDKALEKKNALADDKLGRRPFAESVVQALHHVNKDQGLVLSIEGKWGAGKTSTLAMVEALLDLEESKPLVVHFNPWLVGDRDALLDEFFKELVVALSVPQLKEKSKELVQSLRGFAKEFDASLLPAEYAISGLLGKFFLSCLMWLVQKLVGKPLGLQDRKLQLTNALHHFDRRIVIVIDDIDRLMSAEVFEMIRIIKAIGDLPNVGYVLMWDAEYVEVALKSADVAAADVYLDKIVQVRMSLPALSNPARVRLFNDAYSNLPAEATRSYFPGDQELLPELYQSGLKQLLDQPRDIARLFNRIQHMEPRLRGNVVLADQIGWAALSLHAPLVAKLVHSEFDASTSLVEDLRNQMGSEDAKDAKFQMTSDKRIKAISGSRNPEAVGSAVKFLFPTWTAKTRDHRVKKFRDDQGRISHPNRFRVVTQGGTSTAEVDLLQAQRFILEPESRPGLVAALGNENCHDFLEAVNGLSLIAEKKSDDDKADFFLALAQALDQHPFSTLTKNERWSVEQTQLVIWRVISEMVKKIHKRQGHEIAKLIIADEKSLSMASTLLDVHLIDHDPNGRYELMINENDRQWLADEFAKNVLIAVGDAQFWELALPGKILKAVTQTVSDLPHQIFCKLTKIDTNLDRFAQAVFLAGRSSAGGEYYELNEDAHRVKYSKLCSIDELKAHAENRLADPLLDFPVRAAWMAVLSGKKIFESGEEAIL